MKTWEDKKTEITIYNDLGTRAEFLGVYDIASTVLDNSAFWEWSASSGSVAHHHWSGGLYTHTLEVVNLCFSNSQTLNLNIDSKVLFLGALFHDYGKCWDYAYVDGVWVKTKHARNIHHISRSNMEWIKAVIKYPEYENISDAVSHMILSHHGLREWGSPVAPKSREAWLLHLCDGISTRMDDCDRQDRF